MLTELEKARYARQLQLDGIGLAGQQKLKEASVLIVGAGGLGCPLALYLAAAGVGKIGIIDNDRVSESNLHRQILYTMEDVGRYKVDAALERIQTLNPHISIEPMIDRLSEENAARLIAEYDLVLDGCDNFATRYLINDVCVKLNKVYIYGSVAEFTGQVSVFNHQGGPTYRCLYPEETSCNRQHDSLGVLGMLPGLIAMLQATETVKIICDLDDSLSGVVLVVDLRIGRFDKFTLVRQRD
ncbi:MAG: HesA/MoeB/ThiF family protein [Desulfocapsaceae bacterium]|nr:HesA/MoeB/ThiF family protein [Desulfocapsaceae bacterium]